MNSLRVTEYTIVPALKPDDEEKINRMLKNRWQPLGGPCVNSSGHMFQAMVRYEKSMADIMRENGQAKIKVAT